MIAFLLSALIAPSILIQGGNLVDGTGAPGRPADVRIRGTKIVEIGKLRPLDDELVISAKGLVVCPGFIDAHSHADGGLPRDPGMVSQITQGITTAVVGQDGSWREPVSDFFKRLARSRAALNFAAFSGLGGIRAKVMGTDFKRAATWNEVGQMAQLVRTDMKAGALGVSTGLEYDPGYYSDTEELVELSRVAAAYGGMYISHVRDEGNRAFVAFNELMEIARRAQIPAHISHIKLCSAKVWGMGGAASEIAEGASDTLPRMSADVYPYLFWQSTMAALTPSREWERRQIWVDALRDVGGPQNVRLTAYSHEPAWVGKTISQIAAATARDPISIVQEILRKTRGPAGKGEEGVAVTAMREDDLLRFIKSPSIMFSSDGSPGGTHPRSAGSFPRVLGRYVREKHAISLHEAIRKMTGLPAQTFKLKGRGLVRPGFVADVVVFDPKTIADRATAERPTALSVGVRYVLVSGAVELADGKPTRVRAGVIVRRGQ